MGHNAQKVNENYMHFFGLYLTVKFNSTGCTCRKHKCTINIFLHIDT